MGQIALNSIEYIESIEVALATIVEKSAVCDFYAITYAETLKVTLDSASATQAFENTVSSALPEFYAAVCIFIIKAKQYFNPIDRKRPFYRLVGSFPVLK